jgi:hypothetical protein
MSPHEKMVSRWYHDQGETTLRLNYDLDEHSLVFDLGGYKGQWASDVFSMYRCNIFVFEPVKAYANNIRQRFVKNPNINVFECYVSEPTGQIGVKS